jgi:hypothetical protein
VDKGTEFDTVHLASPPVDHTPRRVPFPKDRTISNNGCSFSELDSNPKNMIIGIFLLIRIFLPISEKIGLRLRGKIG